MNKRLKLEAVFRNLDLGLSSEKEWLIDSMGEVEQKIKEVMDNERYDAAEVKLSHWSHEKWNGGYVAKRHTITVTPSKSICC